MPLYELSIDAAAIREGEHITSLQGRAFPTLVMRWDSRFFEQSWVTTVVLDYLIALPPLMVGQSTFNEVKIAAYVGGAPTKYLYFGTELTAAVPRIAPEMENSMTPVKLYQEFRLEEQTCPLPYLKLINATPRIYGNGPQDYYSPPIKVERYDGVFSPNEHIADFFPQVVANLDAVRGAVLTDPSRGFWNGSRYVGVTQIAILRQGKVVGLHRRVGRADKDPLPAEIRRRDPRLDVMNEWVGIDFGASTTTIGVRSEHRPSELFRLGEAVQISHSSEHEIPTEIVFNNVGRTFKAWRDRVIMPLTRWGELLVGHAAKAERTRPGDDMPARTAAAVTSLPFLRDRIEKQEPYKFRGYEDPDTTEMLKKPAPPIIDEDGIGSHDPFDPIELFAYYVGLTVNHRARGIHLRYAITMPTGYTPERRQSVLVAFRRGIYRSLPAGLVDYHDLERLEVVDVGPSSIALSVQAFRTFNIQPKGDQIPFATIDAGASETGVVFGLLRPAKSEERADGLERVVEYLEPHGIKWCGGERLLHRLAYRLYVSRASAMRDARAPFERPIEEEIAPELEDLLVISPEARANVMILKDAMRPILEQIPGKLQASAKLATIDGGTADVKLEIDRATFDATLREWFSTAANELKDKLTHALTKIGRDPNPYEGLRIIIGGRMGMNTIFDEEFTKLLPPNVLIHRFKEPDKNNLITPTVKTATVLGVLGLKYDRIGATQRAEKRDAFRYRVGRNRHGQLADVLDPTAEYDVWREMGACTKPDVEVIFMPAVDDGEVAADDPRVMRASASLGPQAVGQRLYLRAVASARVELAAGPPGGEPEKGAPIWAIDLKAAIAERV